MSRGPTFGSLFSGIGGLDLGLERAGWECRWQVEVDPFCSRVLAAHWPRARRYGDVRNVAWLTVERVDLLAAGFPCQPVAQNGRRRGTADERWLWPYVAAAVRVLRPRLVLVENVPDLTVRGLGDVLADLSASGYDAEWQVLPASAVGAPHRRERFFLVAYPDSVGCEAGPRVLTRDARASLLPAQTWGPLPDGDTRSGVRAAPDPELFRVADGFPTELDGHRLCALGNAVVPQVTEWIGHHLMSPPSPPCSRRDRLHAYLGLEVATP